MLSLVAPLPISWGGQELLLHPDKAMYWPAQSWLIVSDVHLGKGGHFRKAGIGIPKQVMQHDLFRLTNLLLQFQPKLLLITGDLCHSHHNAELDVVERWRNDLPPFSITLVRGNHDVLPTVWYNQLDIRLIHKQLDVAPFRFIHDPTDPSALSTDWFELAGHVHPGIVLRGLGKQSLRFPCFYFGKQQALLPAFGGFTGTHPVRKLKSDRVFAILPAADHSKQKTNRLIEL